MTQTFGKPRNDFKTPEKERSKEKALRSSDLFAFLSAFQIAFQVSIVVFMGTNHD
jgi:hypothetical protein